MTRTTAGVDRFLVVLLGLALIGAGAFTLAWYFEVPFARNMFAYFDRDFFASMPAQSWWEPVLAAVAVASTMVAIALLVVNLRPRRTGTLQISCDESLAVRIDLGALALGVASGLTQFPEVRSARGRAIDDRGTATLAVTVNATPHIDVDAFTRIAERRAHIVAEAVGGAPIAVRVQLHVDASSTKNAVQPPPR